MPPPTNRKAEAMEYPRGCRLRQVRRAETLLGIYDVMRFAQDNFSLQASEKRTLARSLAATSFSTPVESKTILL